MEIKQGSTVWIMRDGNRVLYTDSMETTSEKCWEKFCWPALNRSAYEVSGYKPVEIILVGIAKKK